MSQLQNFVQEPNLMGAPWISPIDPKWAEHQREMELIEARARADIMKAQMRSELNLQEAERLLRMREDIKIEAAGVAEGFILSADGQLERRQEFLLKPEKRCTAANFCLLSKPRLLRTQGERMKLLLLELSVRGQEKTMVLNLFEEGANYFARKFRESGAQLKLKRGESNEIYLRLVEFLRDQAEPYTVAKYRGFERSDGSEELRYIDEDEAIWEDYKNAAR